jgi:hypothetical protein
LAVKARRNSTKEVNDPLVSTPKDELQFLREIIGRAPEVAEIVGKNLFPEASSSTSIEDSNPVNVKDGCGRLRSEEEATVSTFSSPASNIGERLRSASVNNIFLPESDEKAKAELLQCEKPNVASTSFCESMTASRLRAWSESDNLLQREEKCETIPSSFGRANDPFDTQNLRRALPKSEDQPLSLKVRAKVRANVLLTLDSSFHNTCADSLIEQNIPSSHSLLSSNIMSRSSSYRMLFGNDDEDEILPDDDFLDDWDA